VSGPMDKEEFKRRVFEWAERLDVQVRSLAVRPMKSKWASCSAASNFTFNAELLAFDQYVSDYVIVHELLHFFAPNHGKLWKSLMRAHLGDYEKAQAELEKAGHAQRGGVEL
jgi:predicted metal-dependent hydrolase